MMEWSILPKETFLSKGYLSDLNHFSTAERLISLLIYVRALLMSIQTAQNQSIVTNIS